MADVDVANTGFSKIQDTVYDAKLMDYTYAKYC